MGFCEFCLSNIDPQKNAVALRPDQGQVASFTVAHEDRSGHPLDQPQVVVQVIFPGALGGVFGRLQAKDPASVYVGMPVVLQKSKKNAGPEGVWFKPQGRP